MATRALEPPVVQTTWWHKNWKWLVPAMAVGAVASIALFVGLTFGLLSWLFQGNDAYINAMARVRANPAVVQELGTPIEAGWWFTGSVNINGPSGSADFSAPLQGANGRGTLYVTATKSAGLWKYTVLEVAVEGKDERINLMGESDGV